MFLGRLAFSHCRVLQCKNIHLFTLNLRVVFHLSNLMIVKFHMFHIFQLEVTAGQKKRDFENISENLKKELVVFEEKRVVEFKQKLIHYLETLLETQQTVRNCPA